MSLRDWLAGMTLSGMLANSTLESLTDESAGPPELAVAAYVMADAMLKARKDESP